MILNIRDSDPMHIESDLIRGQNKESNLNE